RGRQYFKVLLIFRHSLCRSAEFFVKHAQASMSYGHWVLAGSGLLVGLFSFLLMQFPIFLASRGCEQLALFLFDSTLLTLLCRVFLRAVRQFFFGQLRRARPKCSVSFSYPKCV